MCVTKTKPKISERYIPKLHSNDDKESYLLYIVMTDLDNG